MNNLLTNETLRRQNLAFVGTGGVSDENRSGGQRLDALSDGAEGLRRGAGACTAAAATGTGA